LSALTRRPQLTRLSGRAAAMTPTFAVADLLGCVARFQLAQCVVDRGKEIATRLSCRSHRGWCHSLNANHENLFSSKICTISIEISIALLGAKTSEV
jgi:hypothetical protein